MGGRRSRRGLKVPLLLAGCRKQTRQKMKRYKNLWDKFISMENLELAAKKAVQSKKNKPETKFFLKHKTELLKKLQKTLNDGKFTTSPYKTRRIFEPKERLIYILPLYPDHIVHHALINILGPIWQSTFIKDSYACIPGKGLHRASKAIMRFVRKYKYVLQCDIRKFYPSINHKVIFNIIKKKIADTKLLTVLRDIIWSCGNETNLPIGNLTSQWMGNVYLNELDHFVKEQLCCRGYIRYWDDFCLFSDNKGILHEYEFKLRKFVFDKLKLIFSKSAIRAVANGVAFIGYRHFKKFIIMRRYGAKKIRKNILNVAIHNDKSELTSDRLAAYHGWTKWCCSHNFLINVCGQAFQISIPTATFIHNKIFKKIDPCRITAALR